MKIDCLFLSLFLSEFVCGIFKIVECNFVDNILYYKPTIGTFEIWTYILLDWLILQGLCILGCFVLFLCIIGFTCLRFCVRVLLDCRLDFLEPLPGNQFVRVYVAFSLFCLVFVLVGYLQMKWKCRIPSGKETLLVIWFEWAFSS